MILRELRPLAHLGSKIQIVSIFLGGAGKYTIYTLYILFLLARTNNIYLQYGISLFHKHPYSPILKRGSDPARIYIAKNKVI